MPTAKKQRPPVSPKVQASLDRAKEMIARLDRMTAELAAIGPYLKSLSEHEQDLIKDMPVTHAQVLVRSMKRVAKAERVDASTIYSDADVQEVYAICKKHKALGHRYWKGAIREITQSDTFATLSSQEAIKKLIKRRLGVQAWESLINLSK